MWKERARSADRVLSKNAARPFFRAGVAQRIECIVFVRRAINRVRILDDRLMQVDPASDRAIVLRGKNSAGNRNVPERANVGKGVGDDQDQH